MTTLLCDIGNTRVKFAATNGEKVVATFALPSRAPMTADSLGANIAFILAKFAITQVEAAVACSVAPELNPILREATLRYLDAPAYFTPEDLPVPLENRCLRPIETGADRLVAAYAARVLFPEAKATIVADFGTAFTFDCASGDEFLGGVILPGAEISLNALVANAARLNKIAPAPRETESFVGRDTASAISLGLLLGTLGAAEKILAKLADELPKPLKKIASGGFAAKMAPLRDLFDVYEPRLIFKGLLAIRQNAIKNGTLTPRTV